MKQLQTIVRPAAWLTVALAFTLMSSALPGFAQSSEGDGADAADSPTDSRPDEKRAFPSFEVQNEMHFPEDSLRWFGETPVLVDFWATWCTPCRFTIPEILRIHRDYGEALEVIGVSVDSGAGGGFRARNWAQEKGVSYRLVHDARAEGRKALDIGTVPVLYLVDTEGKIVNEWSGEPDFDEVRAAIDEVIEKAPEAGSE